MAPRRAFGLENLGACGSRIRRSQKKSRFSSFDFLRQENDGRARDRVPFPKVASTQPRKIGSPLGQVRHWMPLTRGQLTRPPTEAAYSFCADQWRGLAPPQGAPTVGPCLSRYRGAARVEPCSRASNNLAQAADTRLPYS